MKEAMNIFIKLFGFPKSQHARSLTWQQIFKAYANNQETVGTSHVVHCGRIKKELGFIE